MDVGLRNLIKNVKSNTLTVNQ